MIRPPSVNPESSLQPVNNADKLTDRELLAWEAAQERHLTRAEDGQPHGPGREHGVAG